MSNKGWKQRNQGMPDGVQDDFLDDRDDDGLSYDETTGYFRVVDKDYVPFAGSLDAQTYFAVASNDNVQDGDGVIAPTGNFFGASIDFKLEPTGAAKWYVGQYVGMRAKGTWTGNAQVYGQFISVSTRGNNTGAGNVKGIYISLNNESNLTDSIGIDISNYKGSSNTTDKMIGTRVTMGASYAATTEITGHDVWLKTLNNFAETTATIRGVYIRANLTHGAITVTRAVGLDIRDWTGGSTVTNSYAIYIDDSISLSATPYAIYSLSTAPSVFAGEVRVPDDAFATDWNADTSVPNKNAIYDLEVARRPISVSDSAINTTLSTVASKSMVAGEIYKLTAFVSFHDNSLGTAGIKLDFGSAATGTLQAHVESINVSTGAVADDTFLTDNTTDYSVTSVTDGFIKIEGIFAASENGTFGIRVAQQVDTDSTDYVVIFDLQQTS